MSVCHSAGQPTVLLLESDTTVRLGVAASLAEAGFSVIEADSTGAAWMTLETRQDIRVLFADLDSSSDADGLELARSIHDRWPSVGLVITSGHIRHLRPNDIPGQGCFLPRPIPRDTLLQEIRIAAQA